MVNVLLIRDVLVFVKAGCDTMAGVRNTLINRRVVLLAAYRPDRFCQVVR